MQATKRLFLLDAYALIYRSYYAFIKNPRINSKGQNTSAIFGFVNTLEDIIKRENPSHMAVCFDPPGPTFRHEAFEQYKAQREETPEVIRWSVPFIKKIIEAYKIPILEVMGFEADDVIGTISRKAEKAGFEVYMMTPDKDCGQLVTEKTLMYRPKYGGNEFEILGVEEVKQKYGLTSPIQMIDLLGLMGDSSDNIPGCPGIGEVTAKRLLADFGSIDSLLEHTYKLKGSLKEKITGNIELIRFSKFLATIRTDVPIDFNEEQLIREAADIENLKEIYESLEFRTMIGRMGKFQPTASSDQKNKISAEPQKTTLENSRKYSKEKDQFSLWDAFGMSVPEETKKTNSEDEIIPDNFTEENKYSTLESLKSIHHSYHLIDNEVVFSDFIEKISAQNFFSLDTETTSLDSMAAELVGMSFSWIKNEAYYLPFPSNQEESQKKILRLKTILENEKILVIGQNIKYDLVVLKKYGINIRGKLFDTMIAHYLLQPELRHGMDYLAEIYLNYRTVHIDELIGAKGKNQKNMRDIPEEEVCPYAAEDADITLQLKYVLEKELQEANLHYLAYEVEMPLIKVLAEMEFNGVGIDTFSLAQSSLKMTTDLDLLEKEIQKLAGVEFNVNSPKQLGEILFEKLEIGGKPKKTKTGQYSTSEENLENLRSKHPIIEKILEQRGLKKLLSTYIDALPLLINPKTGNLHTSFNQAVTSTGG